MVVFNSFIPLIILDTCKFTDSILFGAHILPSRSSTVLQFSPHLSRLMDSNDVYQDSNQSELV